MRTPINGRTLIACIGIYILLVLMPTIFWFNQWLTYTHFKGDELFLLAEYLFGLTSLFYTAALIRIWRSKYIILLLLPAITIITTFIIGLLFMVVFKVDGTPDQIICIYSVVYSLTNILLSVLIFNRSKRADE